MKRLPVYLGLMLVLMGAAAYSYSVRLNFFTVERDSNEFLLSWQAEVEEDVRQYELFRKTSYSADFVIVQTFPAHGARKEYRFKDDQVYKAFSEEVEYRLDAVFSNGLRQVVTQKSVTYTPTAIRRTWGSMKAMFQ